MCPNGVRYKLGCVACVYMFICTGFPGWRVFPAGPVWEHTVELAFIDASKCESYANEGRDLHIAKNKDKYFCFNFMQMS